MNKSSLIPAATVLMIRDIDDEIEVLMVKRSKKPPFENLFVFPGGKIDEADKDINISNLCDGLDDKEASRKLGLSHGGLSYWVACVRECFEEVGILLAKKTNGEDLDLTGFEKEKYDKYRDKLIRNEISFYDICIKEDLKLTMHNIAPFSHWITPDIETKRFDTRFFIAHLPNNQIEKHDGTELTHSIWINPKEAIKRAFNGEMPMIMPTIKNLQKCENSNSCTELLEHQHQLSSSEIPPILPKFFKKDGRWHGLLPGDEGYENH
tara:strand:- start:1681 stop:2475 length:795 start_codon:yes stop_codon:yes gene_type:complete